MGDRDLFCLGRHFDKTQGVFTSPDNLKMCKETCTLGRDWHVNTDRIRWCDACSKWAHRACMVAVPGYKVYRLSENGDRVEEDGEDAEDADPDEEENESIAEGMEVVNPENEAADEEIENPAAFLTLVSRLPIERFRGPVRLDHTYELFIYLARSMQRDGALDEDLDEEWEEQFLEQLEDIRESTLTEEDWPNGFNNWEGMNAALAISQLARALKNGEYEHTISYLCPFCQQQI